MFYSNSSKTFQRRFDGCKFEYSPINTKYTIYTFTIKFYAYPVLIKFEERFQDELMRFRHLLPEEFFQSIRRNCNSFPNSQPVAVVLKLHTLLSSCANHFQDWTALKRRVHTTTKLSSKLPGTKLLSEDHSQRSDVLGRSR